MHKEVSGGGEGVYRQAEGRFSLPLAHRQW